MIARQAIRTSAEIKALEATPWVSLANDWTTYGLLAEAADRFGDRLALGFLARAQDPAPTVELSYRQLFARVTQAANGFSRLGADMKAPVAVLLPNLIETHLSIWGAEAAGMAAPVNPLLEPPQIAGLLNRIGARVLVTTGPTLSPQLWEKARQVAALVPGLTALVAVGGPGDAGALASLCHDFHALLAAEPADRLVSGRIIGPDDPAACFMTGGTTGAPKVAIQTHRNQSFQARILAEQSQLGTSDVILSGLPLFHVNAVIVTGLSAFAGGGHVVLLTAMGYRDKAVIANFWTIASNLGATTFSAVPTVLAALLDQPRDPAAASTLREVMCGAAPLPLELFQRFEETTGITVREGYGQTEGTCVTSVNPRYGERRPGSVGLRLPYQEVRCVRVGADGGLTDCAANESGRIIIRGPNLFPGYLDPSDNEGCWYEGGWFDTGDLGRLDADGYLWLTGRSKDLIIRGGHNIDPQVIEEGLAAHPGVALTAAIGQPDSYAGELPVAYVVPRPGVTLDPEEVLTFARAGIPERAACPVRIEIIDTMPVTPVGKIHKPSLRLDLARRMVERTLAWENLEGEIIAVSEANGRYSVSLACPQEVLSAVRDAMATLPLTITIDAR